MPKWRDFEAWSFRLNSVTRQVNFNRTKIGGKCQNWNATFLVIFKHCVKVSPVERNKIVRIQSLETDKLGFVKHLFYRSSSTCGALEKFMKGDLHFAQKLMSRSQQLANLETIFSRAFVFKEKWMVTAF